MQKPPRILLIVALITGAVASARPASAWEREPLIQAHGVHQRFQQAVPTRILDVFKRSPWGLEEGSGHQGRTSPGDGPLKTTDAAGYRVVDVSLEPARRPAGTHDGWIDSRRLFRFIFPSAEPPQTRTERDNHTAVASRLSTEIASARREGDSALVHALTARRELVRAIGDRQARGGAPSPLFVFEVDHRLLESIHPLVGSIVGRAFLGPEALASSLDRVVAGAADAFLIGQITDREGAPVFSGSVSSPSHNAQGQFDTVLRSGGRFSPRMTAINLQQPHAGAERAAKPILIEQVIDAWSDTVGVLSMVGPFAAHDVLRLSLPEWHMTQVGHTSEGTPATSR